MDAQRVGSVRASGAYRLGRRRGVWQCIRGDGRVEPVVVGNIYETKSLDEAAYLVCLVFAAGCGARAANSSRGRFRLGWWVLVGALTAWAVGEVLRMFDEVRPDDHTWQPSLTQVALLVFATGACVALLRNPFWRPMFRPFSAVASRWPWPGWPTRAGLRWRWPR